METRLTVIDRVPADDPRAFPSSPGICADAAALLDRVSRLVPPRPPATGVALPLCPRFTCAQRPARARKPRCRRSPWSSVPRQYRTPSNSPTKPAHGRPTDRSAFPALYEGYALQAIRIRRGRTRPSWCVGRHGRGRLAVPHTGAICRPASSPPASSRTRRRHLSPNRLPKSTARSMRSRRSDVAQFAQIPSS